MQDGGAGRSGGALSPAVPRYAASAWPKLVGGLRCAPCPADVRAKRRVIVISTFLELK